MRNVFLFILILVTTNLLAQTYTSTRDGDYSTNSTWVGGTAPDKKISSGMTVNINHAVDMDEDIEVDGGTLLINTNGTFISNKSLIIKDGGSIVADGFVSAKKLEMEGSSSSATFNDSLYLGGEVKIKDGSIALNGNSIFNKKLELLGDATFVANGTLLVKKEIIIKDDVNVTFNDDFRSNKKLIVEGDAVVAINANAYIDGKVDFKDDVKITISSNSIVQITDEFKNDGNSELTINGALIAEKGKENKATINGTGLFQVDGTFTNDGTITGSLNICQSDGTSNPITSGPNQPSGGVAICNLGNDPTNNPLFPITPGAPLPINLTSFYAVLNNHNEVDLVWVTSGELNNDYFTIEKSNENINFIAIEYIPGAGTTNETIEYNYTDKEPFTGKSYYRIKQTDYDGKSKTFDMVSVAIESKADIEVVLYPNPSNGSDNVFLKVPSSEGENFNVLINDLLGRDFISDLTFIEQNDHTLIIIDFDSQLPKGYYLINIVIKGEIITKKLVVD